MVPEVFFWHQTFDQLIVMLGGKSPENKRGCVEPLSPSPSLVPTPLPLPQSIIIFPVHVCTILFDVLHRVHGREF